MADLTIRISAEDHASRDIQKLIGEITTLNKGVSQFGQQSGRSAREAKGLSDNLGGASGGATVLTRNLGGLSTVLGGLGIAAAGGAVFEFGREAVGAAVKVEGFRNSLTALYGDAQVAERVLTDLREASLNPGITFQGAVQGAIRLKTVGIEGDRALKTIKEFGNAAALSGASTEEMTRAVVGLTQTVARGQIEQDNLNQILENVPLIGNAIREAFNSIDAEQIRDQLDAAGQDVQDFTDILLNQLSQGARASADSTANAFSNLGNAVFELQAKIGEGLTPTVRAGAEALTNFFNTITTGLQNLQALSTATELLTESVFNTSTAFSDRASIISYVESLRELRDTQQGIIDQDNWWQYTVEAAEGVAELTRWINLYETALAGVPTASAELRTELEASNAQYAEQRAARVELLSHLKAERESIYGNVGLYQDQYDANEALITQNRAKAQVLENIIKALDDTTEAETEAAESARLAGIVQKVLSESYTQSADAAGQLASELKLLRETVTENESAQERLNEFWQAASGQLETYSGSVDLATVSLAKFRTESELLFGGDLADPLQAEIDQFGTLERAIEKLSEASLSFVADQAFLNLEIKNVNPAISDAVDSMRDYIDVMDGVQTEFQSVETLSDMVTASVREQASAFDALRRAVDGVTESQSRLPGQQIGSGALDSFDPSSPTYTRNQGFFDPRISGGTFEDSVRELGVNLGEFTEGFTLDINSIVRAMEGTAEPFDVFESAIVSINPALGIFTTGLRLLGQEFEEAERGRRRRREFERLGGTEGFRTQLGPRESFNRSRLGGGISGTDLPDPTGLIIGAFGGFYENILQDLQENLRQAEFNLDFSRLTGGGVNDALQGIITAQTEFYLHQIDEINRVRIQTGNLSFGNAEELARTVQGIINDARLALESTSNVTRFTPVTEQGRTPGTRYNATTGQFEQIPTAGSESRAPAGSQDPDLEPPTIDLEALQTRIASRVPNDALGAIRTAATDANVTEQTILELWQDTQPELEDWYQELLDDANAIVKEADKTEALAELGSLPDFIASLKSQYVTPVVSGLRSSAEALQTRTATRLANAALGAIRTAASDANVTESEIVSLWTGAQPFLETWYQELLDDANAIVKEADKTEALAELGSLPDFVERLKSQYVTPVISGIRSSAEALETRTATRLANDALGAIREAAEDANITESEIVQLWTDAQPFLETWYQELLDDANAIVKEADKTEALAELGSLPDFVERLKSQYVTPVVSGLRSSAEALQTRTATRLANAALGAIRTAASDANVTESEIVSLWTGAQPFLETWYQELLDDANAIVKEADKTEALAELGSLPDFVERLKSQYVTPVISGIRSSAEALETRTATRLANDALGAIREAAEDVNITESAIVQLWTDAQPFLETWYQELLDDANAIVKEADKTEALAALGSLPDFIERLKSQYVTPVISGIRSSAEALQTRTATRLANDALGAIREAAEDVNITESAIVSLWTGAQPFLETWYQELLDDANAIVKEADKTEALAALGTLPQFIASLKSQYVTPVVTGLRSSAEALQTRTANRLANEALGAIREAASDANVTEAEIVQLWTDAQPFLETWYQELLDDANAIVKEADKTEALAELGSLPDFVERLKSQYVTPVISGIRSSAEALETRTATRLANDALGAIREAAEDVNITESAIVQLWTDAQPFLETWYQELLDDANAIVKEADKTEALAALGTLPQFIASLKSQYVTPVVTGLRASAEALETRTANRLANDALGAIRTAAEDANVTESAIVSLWTGAQPFLETWYQELLDDANAIVKEADKTEALAELGSLPDFVASLKSQYVTPVISGLRSAGEALETRTANRLANDALGAIRTAATDANVTESAIVSLWTNAQPVLEAWYQELLDDANAIENDAERGEALSALGSLPDFISNLKSQYVSPVISGLRSAGEALETRTANRLANDALGAIRTAAADANVTESAIVSLWTDAQPLLETWYQELLDDANAIENDAERNEALAALGSLPQFIASLKSQYVTPVITGIRSAGEALETRTANRLASDALGAIGEAARGVNTTVDQILLLWNEARPAIVAWYNELRQDIETDISLSDAQRTEDLASLGNLSDFVAGIRQDTVAPFLNRLRSRGFQSRSNLAQNVVDRSRFLLSTATSQEEFDSERANLVRSTNSFYDLEEDRISNLMLSEMELQDLREDIALARIRRLGEIEALEFRSLDRQLSSLRGVGGGGIGGIGGTGGNQNGVQFTSSSGASGGGVNIGLTDDGSLFRSGIGIQALFGNTRRFDTFSASDYPELAAKDPVLFATGGAEAVAEAYPEVYRPDFDAETGRNDLSQLFSSQELINQFTPEQLLSELTAFDLYDIFGSGLKDIFSADQLLEAFTGQELGAVFGLKGLEDIFTPEQVASEFGLSQFQRFFPPDFISSPFGKEILRLLQSNSLFHFAETDMRAKQAGIESGIATHEQLKNATDFSKYFGEGFVSSFAGLLENTFDFSDLDIDKMPTLNMPEVSFDTSDIEVFLSQDSIDKIVRGITESKQQNQTQQQSPMQKVEVAVQQLPPSDNFLLEQNDRTTQVLEARNI